MYDDLFYLNAFGASASTSCSRLSGPTLQPTAILTGRPGSVVGIWIEVLAASARTAGTATASLFITGASQPLTAVLDGTNTAFKFTAVARGLYRFASTSTIPARLEVVVTTVGFTPNPANFRCGLAYELDD